MSGSDSDEKTATSAVVLSEANYGAWKRNMISLLRRKRALLYVTGRKPCPVKTAGVTGTAAEKEDEKIVEWEEKDEQATGYITANLPHTLQHLADTVKTSKELWDAIVLKFEGNRSKASVALLVLEIVNRRWEETSGSLEKHIAWFRENNELLAKFDIGSPAVIGPQP
ncbi:MAG: gag-polypeptide of copia-type [Massilia sp.]|nr:gag-polypeptide of copia-type [Massilia sp.]